MKFLFELFNRNRLLTLTGLAMLFLAAMLLVLMPSNSKEVMGINSLIKPLKFAFSLWIFSWTMAWFSAEFADRTYVRRLSKLIMVTTFFEQGVITVQAFRGTLSHFNMDAIPDFILFSLMGVMIVWLTVFVALGAKRLRKQPGGLHQPYRLAIYLGIWMFVLSGVIGGVMSALNTHAVGTDMGGPGLPFLNWSTIAGDLRVSHFFGMHALQVLPFMTFQFQRNGLNAEQSKQLLKSVTAIYFIFVLFTLAQALLIIPFWGS
jgi:hypothetical protein